MKLDFSTDPESLDDLDGDWAEMPAEDTGERKILRIEDLRQHRVRDLAPSQIEWDVEGIIPRKSVCLISGPPGSGKSTFASALGYAVSKGQSFVGRQTSKRPVLILDRENPDQIVHERFARLGIQEHDDFMVFGQWIGEEPPGAGDRIIVGWVNRCEPRPLIIIDSFIAFHEGSENEAQAVRAHIKLYRALSASGATTLILHHPGKSESSQDYRGSSDIEASVDIAYKLTNKGDGAKLSVLELRAFKQRISVTCPLNLRYQVGQFTTDDREPAKTIEASLIELLKAKPGITKADFEKSATEHGLARTKAREFISNGVESGIVRVDHLSNNRQAHYWNRADLR